MGRKGEERRQTTQGSNSGTPFTTEIHSDKTVMKHNLTTYLSLLPPLLPFNSALVREIMSFIC